MPKGEPQPKEISFSSQCCPGTPSVRTSLFSLSLSPCLSFSILVDQIIESSAATMSAWPSSYGYKYTPIGLRQREKRDDSGKRSICTTVHLPEGGHLLEIDREYGIDGSMSKRETQNMAPSALAATRPLPPTRGASPQPSAIADFFEPRPASNPSDFERAADDIIANFRARHGVGLDNSFQLSQEPVQRLEDTYGKYSSSLRREVLNAINK